MFTKSRAVCLSIALSLIACRCLAASGDHASLAGHVTETKLPDGLTVLLLESHDAPVACTYVYYKVGSRNETTGITGVSHQLEHMMFKGTQKRFPTPGYIDLLIGRHGGVNNAETTTDYTDYFLLVPADQLDLALRIESDRMTGAAIDPQQLVAEKRVVLSELEGDENQNSDLLYNSMRSAAFVFHPYHYPVIGSKWDVQHFTRSEVYEYYRNHYCPNNAVLVVVGDFEAAPVLKRIRELWKDVQSHPVPAGRIDPEPAQMGERRITITRAGSTAYVNAAYHIPPASSSDLPVLDVLSAILTTGRSSRLYRSLVDTQLASQVNSGANYGLDPELFEILVTARAGVDAERVEAALLPALDELKTTKISDHELQKAKNETRAAFVFGQDGVQARANRLGYFQLVTGSWKNIDTYIQRVDAVTPADIQRVCTKYFVATNRTIARFVPNGEKADPSADASQGGHGAHYKSTSSARFGPGGSMAGSRGGQAAHHSLPVSVRLANGLTLIVQADHSNPTVTVSGFVRAGSVNDPEGKYGVANLTAALLTHGTASRTAQEIAEATDFVGAGISMAAHRERIEINATMLKESFPEIVKVLADCLQSSTFPDAEVEKVRGEAETAIHEAVNDTAQRATSRLMSLIYPADTAFGHDVTGDLDSVKQITSADVRNFYAAAVRPENIVLVIVGDLDATAVIAEFKRDLEPWKSTGAGISSEHKASASPPAAQTAPTEAIVMRDKSQDDIAMGEQGLSRKSPDYEAVQLMNLILGGDEFVGRVGKRVRDTEGLAYYAYTAFTPAMQIGPWVFRAGVNPANVVKAIASAKDEIGKMAKRGVKPEELSWAKDNMIGTMELSMETAAGIASQLEDDAFFGLGLDYAQRFPAIVRHITAQQANAAAARYLRVGALATVVAGPQVPGLNAQTPSNAAR